jgi:hypothetical protein
MDREPLLGLRSSILMLEALLGRAWRLIAPRYQRPYSWTENEVGRLFEDLMDAYRYGRRHYFLGTAVVIFSPGGQIAEIVDGQQRLATLTLMIAALRDRLSGPDRAALEALISTQDGPRLSLRQSDNAFMTQYVYTPGQMAALAKLPEDLTRPPPQAKIIDAARAIETALDAVGPDKIAGLARFIRGGVVFNLLEIEDRDEAPRMFAVLNETGMDLSTADLAKAELFARAGLSEEEADQVAARWDEWVNDLGPRGMETLLAVVPSIVAGAAVEALDITQFRNLVLNAVDARRFLDVDLPALVEGFKEVRLGDVKLGAASAEINRRIKIMRWLKDTFWIGPAFAILAIHRGDPDLVVEAFARLERFAFAGMMAVIPAHEQSKRQNRIFAALRDPQKLVGAGGVFDLTGAELRDMKNKLTTPYRRDHNRRRLIVLRANAAMGETLNQTDDANVEHVLPHSAAGEWAVIFRDATLREMFTNAIGNLTLLTPPQNRLAGDKPFGEKCDLYFKSKDAPVRALTEMLRGLPAWTPEAVRRRTEQLLAAILSDWRLS